MDPGMFQIFVREVGRQAQFGLTAAADLNCAVTSNDTDRVWYSIQSLLLSAGNVSKLLWSKSASPSLGDTLRTTLKVENDSPLESRRARNHFEHFDERIKKWDISAQSHMVIDSNIGNLESIKGGASAVYVRNYDPSTGTLAIYDEVFELRPVIEAIEMLRSQTEQVLR